MNTKIIGDVIVDAYILHSKTSEVYVVGFDTSIGWKTMCMQKTPNHSEI